MTVAGSHRNRHLSIGSSARVGIRVLSAPRLSCPNLRAGKHEHQLIPLTSGAGGIVAVDTPDLRGKG